MKTHTIRLHRVLRASPLIVYKAFVEPDALAKWLPPHGYTAKVHAFDARVGGAFRLSFTNLASGATHSFGGEFVELIPGEFLRYTDKFDDPSLKGEILVSVYLKAVPLGCDLSITQEGIPSVIPEEACHLGWQESLQLLSLLVEGARAEGEG